MYAIYNYNIVIRYFQRLKPSKQKNYTNKAFIARYLKKTALKS